MIEEVSFLNVSLPRSRLSRPGGERGGVISVCGSSRIAATRAQGQSTAGTWCSQGYPAPVAKEPLCSLVATQALADSASERGNAEHFASALSFALE